MQQKKLKIGVIGLGGRVDGFLKWAFVCKVENFEVVAAVDVNREIALGKFKESPNVYAADARYYDDADEMLEKEELDGVFVGTTARFHVVMAEKVMKKGIPLFLEKPVAVDWEDLNKLNEARKKYNPKCLVSFPLRNSPMSKRIREIIESGRLGRIEQIQAWNDVAYGRVYQHGRNHNYVEVSGELWLEKATHDLDIINYYMGELPDTLCAMESNELFGGDMPKGMTCDKCEKCFECPESNYTVEKIYGDRRHGGICCYEESYRQHDCATVVAKYPSGAHIMYSQNHFVRFQAGRRGGRIYGYKGTLEYDINNAELKIMMHDSDTVEKIKFHGITDPHCGGDQILSFEFEAMMRGKDVKNTLLEGIQSAAFGLTAADSCKKNEFLKVPTME